MLETEYEIKYNKYRLRALREEYNDDEALNRDIAKRIDDIYFKVVPPDVRVAVEADVDQAREQEWFEKNTFSIICLSDEDDERFLTCRSIHSVFDAAVLYTDRLEGVVGLPMESIIECFEDQTLIDESTYCALARAMPNDEQIAENFRFDFDSGILSVTDPDEGTSQYLLSSLASNIKKARQQTSWEDDQREIFYDLVNPYMEETKGIVL